MIKNSAVHYEMNDVYDDDERMGIGYAGLLSVFLHSGVLGMSEGFTSRHAQTSRDFHVKDNALNSFCVRFNTVRNNNIILHPRQRENYHSMP